MTLSVPLSVNRNRLDSDAEHRSLATRPTTRPRIPSITWVLHYAPFPRLEKPSDLIYFGIN